MTKRANYEIIYADKTITVTKAFYKEASTLGTIAYNTLLAIRKDYPDFEIAIKTVKKKSGKETYHNLTVKKMREYIVFFEGLNSAAEKEFDQVCTLAQVQAGRYAFIKSWFLKRYKERIHSYDFSVEEQNNNSAALTLVK